MNDENLLKILEDIRNNDDTAFTKFWNQYFDQVVALARRRLSQQYRRIRDEEDIAVSAIHSFYRGLTDKRFRNIESSNELWKILVTLVCRKIAKNIRSQNSQKRGGGNVRGESFLDSPASFDGKSAGIGNIQDSNGLTPLLEIEFLDTCEKMFEMLEEVRH
jgi:hypothetical protein